MLAFDRVIRGFKLSCYIDHKSNLLSEAQLYNRRRSKEMSKWAPDLQWSDLIRAWIIGEKNILGHVPSRAPWELELARHLPIPDKPARELVYRMCQPPKESDLWVRDRACEMLGGEPRQKTLVRSELSGAALVPEGAEFLGQVFCSA